MINHAIHHLLSHCKNGDTKTGGELSGVEKSWEGNCPKWQKDGRGIVHGGKKTRGGLSGVEKRREGNCLCGIKTVGELPGVAKDGRGIVYDSLNDGRVIVRDGELSVIP